MVAAFRDDARDTQLPFYHGANSQSQPSPSFDYTYADPGPVDNPFLTDVHPVQVNPRTRPVLAKGAIVTPPHGSHRATPPHGSHRATKMAPGSNRHGSLSRSQTVRQPVRQPHLFSPATSALANPGDLETRANGARNSMGSPLGAIQLGTIQPVHRSSPERSSVALPSVNITANAVVTRREYPKGLRWLMLGQKGLCCVTLSLVGVALALYGQSVYQHRQWGLTYSQLEQLQKLEQQGMAASEIMKHSLAEEAERPDSGMRPQMPGAAVPIETLPARAWDEAPDLSESLLDVDLDGPMGY